MTDAQPLAEIRQRCANRNVGNDGMAVGDREWLLIQYDAVAKELEIRTATNEAHCTVIEGVLKILGAKNADPEEAASDLIAERDALAARVALLEAELEARRREAQLAWNGLCGVTAHIRKLVLTDDAPAAVDAQEGNG